MTTATDGAATHPDDFRNEFDATTPPASRRDDNRMESLTLMSTIVSARHALIAEAAYRRVKKRGFAGGADWQDWFEAEREVNELFDPSL
jgi:hypothetical protein